MINRLLIVLCYFLLNMNSTSLTELLIESLIIYTFLNLLTVDSYKIHKMSGIIYYCSKIIFIICFFILYGALEPSQLKEFFIYGAYQCLPFINLLLIIFVGIVAIILDCKFKSSNIIKYLKK